MAVEPTDNKEAPEGGIRLSIVVPCYNTAAYLPKCLDSLRAQTLDGIEVICVNDGSPDEDLEVMERYATLDPALFRVVSQENGGLWNARWSGTDAARGEYVAYVDSDDWVDPGFAADLYQTAMREDADVVVCGFRRVDEATGRETTREMAEPRAAILPAAEPGRLVDINSAAWNKCFRRDLLLRMHRLENPPSILEDVTLTQLAYLSAERPVAFTGTAPYHYLVREGSMINTITLEQVQSVKRALLEVRRAYVAERASEALLAELDATAFLHLGVSVSFRLSRNPKVDLRAAIGQTTEYLDEHFPTWARSPYITPAAARESPGMRKLLIAQRFYKMRLMKPFLAAYRFAIERLGIEVKW